MKLTDYEKLIEDNQTYLSHLHNLLNLDKAKEIKLSTSEKIKIIKESREIQKDLLKFKKFLDSENGNIIL